MREAQKLSQKELAKLVDLDYTTVSKHESGERRVSIAQAIRYARVFKCEPDAIFLDA